MGSKFTRQCSYALDSRLLREDNDDDDDDPPNSTSTADLQSIFQNQTRPETTAANVDDDDAMSFVTANETTGSPNKERRTNNSSDSVQQELPLIPTLSKELTPKRSGKNPDPTTDVVSSSADGPPPPTSLLQPPAEDDEGEHRDHQRTPQPKGVLADPNSTTLLNSNMSPIPFPNQPFIRMSAEVEYGDAKDVGSLSSASTESSRLLMGMSSSQQQQQQHQHSRWIKQKHLPSPTSSPGSQNSSTTGKVLFNPLHIHTVDLILRNLHHQRVERPFCGCAAAVRSSIVRRGARNCSWQGQHHGEWYFLGTRGAVSR